MDVHMNNETLHNSLRSSARNIEAEVFIITAVKCRLMATLIVVICVMILLFLAPIVWYNTDPPGAETYVTESAVFHNLEIASCMATCPEPNSTWLMDYCNLTEYQDCELISTAVFGLHSIYHLGLSSAASQCNTSDALSFFCNAILLLCNGNSPSVELTEECEEVRDNKCASEWRIVESICNISVVNCSSYSGDGNVTFSKAPNQDCPTGFDHFCDSNSICLPVCGEKIIVTEGTPIYYVNRVAYSCGILGFIVGIIAIIVCYYNAHKLLQFPRIFIVYKIVIWQIFLGFALLPIIVPSSECSDRNYLKSIRKRAYVCEIQGFMLQFLYSCFVGFWCFHLLHLFLGLTFPFTIKVWMDSSSCRKKIHITEVVIVILYGLLSPIIAVSVTKQTPSGIMCLPQSNSVEFYGYLLPNIALFCIGLVFIFTSWWILLKKHHSRSNNINFAKIFCVTSGWSVAEIKLSLLFGYYVLVMLSYFSARMVLLMSKDELVADTDKFVACSLGGAREYCEKYKLEATKSLNAPLALLAIAVLLYSMISFTHLIYVIRFQTVREAIRKTCNKH
ncbi:uncharacterized protein [Dysidea avara]